VLEMQYSTFKTFAYPAIFSDIWISGSVVLVNHIILRN